MLTCNRTVLVAAAVLMLGNGANAFIFEYGDFLGTDVVYLSVTEDTRDEPNALFGAPDILGNTLDFDPLSFSAGVSSVTGTASSEIVDGQLNFTIMSNLDTFGLDDVIIREAGDYTLTGLGNAQATASVAAPVRWTITQVNGVDVATPVTGSDSMTFVPVGTNGGGDYALPADLGNGVSWSGNLFVDVDGFAAANVDGWQAGDLVTKVEFVLDNTLSVAAAEGGSAFIAKKDFNGVTIIIPEPNSLALLAWGVVFPMILCRRRSASGK